MNLNTFDYPLPEGLIARQPAEPRDACRLMVYDRKTQAITHTQFKELPHFLNTGDLLALNNTKVIRARLFAQDSKGGAFEIFLLEPKETALSHWVCLAKPGKKIKQGITLQFAEKVSGFLKKIKDEVCEITFQLPDSLDFWEWLESSGKMPLPPYIKREAIENDSTNYQTVFAKSLGSVAAPTAGLHFTETVFSDLRAKEIEHTFLTLHVGYGTFSPIRCEKISDHQMHRERYEIAEPTFEKILAKKKNKQKVVAVGTTSLRALESIPQYGRTGSTDIFITPGFQFQYCDALLTNFHLPKSTLLILVSAFMGREQALNCYQIAIEKKYQFFSYGDAMLIL